jgi:hypothetical protein
MKFFRIVVFGLILCLSFTSCSKINVNKNNISSTNIINNVSNKGESTKNEQDYNKLFELNLYSDKQKYKTTDKIKIWATLKYIGQDSQIKIWHSNPYISFTITDGKKFNTGGFSDDILTTTILVKDKLYRFDYTKSGGFSADDSNADYWKKFYQEKDLHLPEGEYTVKVGGAFFLNENPQKSKSNLVKELKIKVEN